MDTSESYIKMCDCPEIQKGWRPKDGDIYFCQEMAKNLEKLKQFKDINLPDNVCFGIVVSGTVDCPECGTEDDLYPFDKFFPPDDVIWLPRQDQLQEMVWDENASDPMNVFGILGAAFEHGYDFVSRTFEQLWLAFVMWELHKKKWDGEKWV